MNNKILTNKKVPENNKKKDLNMLAKALRDNLKRRKQIINKIDNNTEKSNDK